MIWWLPGPLIWPRKDFEPRDQPSERRRRLGRFATVTVLAAEKQAGAPCITRTRLAKLGRSKSDSRREEWDSGGQDMHVERQGTDVTACESVKASQMHTNAG